MESSVKEETTHTSDEVCAKMLTLLCNKESIRFMHAVPGPSIHDVNILSEFYTEVIARRKTFEIRKNDRKYKVGDIVILNDYNDEKRTGSYCVVQIQYILDASCWGLQPGYCVFCWNPELLLTGSWTE